MSKSHASLLPWFGLTLLASLLLFHTSDRVNALSRKLTSLDAQIEAEQESMHVLRAEWVYLSNPARIAAEIKGHLDLQPTPPADVATLDATTVAALLPMRDGLTPAPQVRVAATEPHDVGSAAHTAHRRNRVFASINAGHITDHVILQHSATSAEASDDGIGALIASLGTQQ
ncbi:MAG: hypothetical protein KGI97_00985 [Alphaproteobacteria bacterium]|nr:hypothetical protein [Alphaproteobacteria bacterium]